MFKGGEIISFTDKLRARATIIYFSYVFIFIVEFTRSYINLDYLVVRYYKNFYMFADNTLGYVQSYLVAPLLTTVIFVYIINHIKTAKNIDSLIKLLLFSMCIFAFVTLWFGIEILISGGGRSMLREVLGENLGFHYNTIAAFFMMTIPLAFAKAQSEGNAWYIIFVVLILALLTTQSRGAIIGTIGGVLFYLYSLKKISYSQIIILIILFTISYLLAEPLQKLLTQGIESGDLSVISSGRIDNIWLPLLNEMFTDTIKLMSGLGLFGIIVSDVFVSDPFFFQTSLAHNAIVDLLVDCGVIIFVFFSLLVINSMKKAISWFRYIDDPLYKGLISSIVAFLIGCLTGRQFYPRPENMLIYLIISLAVVYVIIARRELTNEIRERKRGL